MKKNNFKNFFGIKFWRILAIILLIIVLILAWFCCQTYHENKECSRKNLELLSENGNLEDSISIYIGQIKDLKSALSKMNQENRALVLENLNLRNQVGIMKQSNTYLKRAVNALNKINKNYLNELSKLNAELDSCNKLNVADTSLADTLVSELDSAKIASNKIDSTEKDSVISGSLVITKTVKSKKINESDTLYREPIFFSLNNGFLVDSTSYKYEYSNRKNNPSSFNFNLYANANFARLKITKTEGTKKSVLLKDDPKEFPVPFLGYVGVGGLSTSLLEKSWSWSDRFYERSREHPRRCFWEIGTGTAMVVAGGVGLHYFNNHPVSTTNIYLGDKLYSQIKIPNYFGKGISKTAIGVGTGLITFGILDRFIFSVSPAEISAVINLENSKK